LQGNCKLATPWIISVGIKYFRLRVLGALDPPPMGDFSRIYCQGYTPNGGEFILLR
jgi:hypothetical protein